MKNKIFLFMPMLCLTAVLSLMACENKPGEWTTTLELSSSSSASSLTFSATGGAETITVNTNATGWSVSCASSWVEITKIQNLFIINVEPNGSPSERSATVTVATADNARTEHLIVSQAGITSTGTYTVGSYYNENGVRGVVYKVSPDGRSGMIVSLTEAERLWAATNDDMLINTGATDLNNGMNNMNIIKAISGWETKFPAFKWCNDFNTGGITGWYFPALEELRDLYAGYNANRTQFNNALTSNGGAVMHPDRNHWSSSENTWDHEFAHWLEFASGQTGSGEKSYYPHFKIRAVRAF